MVFLFWQRLFFFRWLLTEIKASFKYFLALFFNASNKKVQYMAARSLIEDMGASGRR